MLGFSRYGGTLDLLPLKQAFTSRNIAPPPALLNAIDRMMPMLRFFRHGDGNFALFNGMGPTPTDVLTTILAYDDARGAPLSNAPHSGYQRLQARSSVVIVDAEPGALADQPWAMRDFVLIDPAGVMWRIAHNTPRR